ncbi:MAG: pilus assembly FimT family protein [Fimbriimonadaceae bacterium]
MRPRCLRASGHRLRRAFTLVEMIVVCTVLVITAALIAPNMAHMRDAQLANDAVPSLERLISYARESAIAQHTTDVLTFDSSASTFTVKQDTTADPNAPTASSISASQGAGSSALPATGSGPAIVIPAMRALDANNPAINKTLQAPRQLQFSSFQVAGKDVAAAEFQLRFYQDGTCDSGAIGFTIASSTQSIVVDDFGQATFIDGPIPDPSTLKWEAGQFEPRQAVP